MFPVKNLPLTGRTLFEGFTCNNNRCGKEVRGRFPVRRSEEGPFFCSLVCGMEAFNLRVQEWR